jgi:hypothetical protein
MAQADETRLVQFKSNVRAEYDRYSIVKKIVDWREAKDDKGLTFVQIGNRFHIPAEVLIPLGRGEPDVAPNIIGLGESIALGEENYLVKQLVSNISNMENGEELSMTSLVHTLSSLGMNRIRSVLIP